MTASGRAVILRYIQIAINLIDVECVSRSALRWGSNFCLEPRKRKAEYPLLRLIA